VQQGSAGEHRHYMHDYNLYYVNDYFYLFMHRSNHRDQHFDFADHGLRDCGDANSISSGRFGRDK
jgi:hypothetical protein